MLGTPLPMLWKACEIDVADLAPREVIGDLDEAEILELCRCFRRMAICELFLSGVPDEFFEFLFRSSRAFLHFVQRLPPGRCSASRAVPFFDAIACDDILSANTIARLVRGSWNEQDEPHEDFIYIKILMLFAAGIDSPDELDRLLRQFEAVLNGTDDSRLAICRSLARRSDSEFDRALTTLIANRRGEISEAVRAEQVSPDTISSEAKLSVEVLALLQLAGRVGVSTNEEYPLAPSVARDVSRSKRADAESWKIAGAPVVAEDQ